MATRLFIRILFLATISSMPSISYSADWDGNRLSELISSDDKLEHGPGDVVDYQRRGILLGYVRGVSEEKMYRRFCPPEGTTVDQVLAVVKKYIRDNPTTWNQPANVRVTKSLSIAFPCKK